MFGIEPMFDTPPLQSNVRTLSKIKTIDHCVFTFLKHVHTNWKNIDETELMFARDMMSRISDDMCNREILDLFWKSDCLVLRNRDSEHIILSMNERESVRAFYLEGDVDVMIEDEDMDFVVMYLIAVV